MAEIKSDADHIGEIQISDEVIATIAGTAALEVEGVYGGTGIRSYDDIVEKMGRKNLAKGVKISVTENRVTADLSLLVKMGSKVQEVAENVQKKVKNAIETMTGLEVDEVNVSIIGITMPKETAENQQ